MSIEAMKLALEALEDNFDVWTAKTKAITSLRRAIAEAEQAQPVATKLETQQFNCFHVSAEDFQKLKALPVGTKIYTAPPPRQPEQEQPVAVDRSDAVNLARNLLEVRDCKGITPHGVRVLCKAVMKMDALYTAPPRQPWIGLTDDEIDKLREANSEGRGAGWRFNFKGFARAIEAKLKEKNT